MADLRAALDGVYLADGYVVDWLDLTGIPAGFADGVDDGFTTKAELTALLDDTYLAVNYSPSWSDLTDVPTDLLDGDQDTTYTVGPGLVLDGTTIRLDEYNGAPFIPNSRFQSGDLTDWTITLGAGSVQAITGGPAGDYVLRNAPLTGTWVSSNARIPLRPNQNYTVSGQFRRAEAIGNNGTFYLVVRAFDANGDNIAGDGTWWYYPISAAIPDGNLDWQTYSFNFGPDYGGLAIPANATTISVGAILNYDGGNRTYEVTNLQLTTAKPPTRARYLTPTLTNSWANYGSGYANAGYYLGADGRVYLRGLIRNGSVGSAAFTLPPGMRPSARLLLGTVSNGVVGRVDITAAGEVLPSSPSTNGWVALDGLSFAPE